MTRLKRWGRELLLSVVLLACVLWAMDLCRTVHASCLRCIAVEVL